MTDNIHTLPTRIERLWTAIQNTMRKQAEHEDAWRETTYDLCLQLAEMRELFSSNVEFGRACEANGLTLNHQTRAAAIAMGREPEALRACLEATKSRSIHVMHSRDFERFTNVCKTERPRAEKRRTTIKKDETLAIARQLDAEGYNVTPKLLEEKAGVSYGTAQRAWQEHDLERRRAPPPLDPATSAPSVRERMEGWQRAERKRLREVIHEELKAEYDLRGEAWVKDIREREAWAKRILETRLGIMPKDEYQAIVKCLHPDTQPSSAQKAEAFRLFTQYRDVLLKPEPPAYAGPPLPSLGEMLAMKRAREEARRRK